MTIQQFHQVGVQIKPIDRKDILGKSHNLITELAFQLTPVNVPHLIIKNVKTGTY